MLKKEPIKWAVITLFVLFTINVGVMWYYFNNQYTIMNRLIERSQIADREIASIVTVLKDLHSYMNTVYSQLSDHTNSLLSLQEKLSNLMVENKKNLASINNLKQQLQMWRDTYTEVISSMIDKQLTYQDKLAFTIKELEALKGKEINLGKISVKKKKLEVSERR